MVIKWVSDGRHVLQWRKVFFSYLLRDFLIAKRSQPSLSSFTLLQLKKNPTWHLQEKANITHGTCPKIAPYRNLYL
jgi:hypothetical protein